MKERGIIFTGESVRAILDGSKTQTRRVVRPQPEWNSEAWYWSSPRYDNGDGVHYFHTSEDAAKRLMVDACPYGISGDRLWVRETWHRDQSGGVWGYYADHDPQRDGFGTNVGGGKVPAIFMPRWASRLTLEVVAVRVQRLQEITEEDALAEAAPVGQRVPMRFRITGVDGRMNTSVGEAVDFTARGAFCHLWDGINGKRAPWASNPFVWAITFTKVETTHASDARHPA